MSLAVQALCLVAAISGLCFGYDTGVISAALVNMGTDLGHPLSDTEKGWISSGTSCGAILGGLSGGVLADLFGRKWILALADSVLVAGGIIICTSSSPIQVIVGRLVLGAGVGVSSAIAPLYIAELAPTRRRGMLLTINALAITGGQLLSYLIALPLTGHGGWRILFAIGIAPAIMQAAAVHFLPESPRYDLNKGRVEAARRTLRIVYKGASEGMIDLKMAAIQDAVDLSHSFQEKHTFFQRLLLVFRRPTLRRPALIIIFMGAFQQLSGWNTLMYYSGTLFTNAGIENPIAAGLAVSGVNFAVTILAFFVLDRIGKRAVLLCSVPAMMIGLSLAALAFAKMTASTGGLLLEGYPYSAGWCKMMIGMVVIYAAGYGAGMGNVIWHANELFPLELRGVGAAMLTGTNWGANFLVTATFLNVMSGLGAAGAFGLYAGICLLGLVIIAFCYPETTGLSLEDVQTLFDDGFGVGRSIRLRRQYEALRKQRSAGSDDVTE